MSELSVHIIVADAARASDWYRNVLGAEECSRITLPDGRLIHVELSLAGSRLILADEFPDQGAVSPPPDGTSFMALYLSVGNVTALWQRAVDAGAKVHRDLQDTPFGERDGQLIDPFGYRWGLTQHIRDVTLEEKSRAATEVFASHGADHD